VALPVKDPFHVARALLLSVELDAALHVHDDTVERN